MPSGTTAHSHTGYLPVSPDAGIPYRRFLYSLSKITGIPCQLDAKASRTGTLGLRRIRAGMFPAVPSPDLPCPGPAKTLPRKELATIISSAATRMG